MGEKTKSKTQKNPTIENSPAIKSVFFLHFSTAGNRSRTTPRSTSLPAAAASPTAARIPKATICAGYGPARHPGAGDTISLAHTTQTPAPCPSTFGLKKHHISHDGDIGTTSPPPYWSVCFLCRLLCRSPNSGHSALAALSGGVMQIRRFSGNASPQESWPGLACYLYILMVGLGFRHTKKCSAFQLVCLLSLRFPKELRVRQLGGVKSHIKPYADPPRLRFIFEGIIIST